MGSLCFPIVSLFLFKGMQKIKVSKNASKINSTSPFFWLRPSDPDIVNFRSELFNPLIRSYMTFCVVINNFDCDFREYLKNIVNLCLVSKILRNQVMKKDWGLYLFIMTKNLPFFDIL